MFLDIKTFKSFFPEPAKMVCGPHVTFSRTLLDVVLNLYQNQILKEVYFLLPSDTNDIIIADNVKYLQKTIREVFVIRKIKEISNYLSSNFFIVGIKESDLNTSIEIKKIKGNIIINFEKEVGAFKLNWHSDNILITEKPIETLFSKPKKEKEIQFSPPLKKTLFFANRNKEKKELDQFLNDQESRCCKICGIGGIGKDEFVIDSGITSGKYIEYEFISRESDLYELLSFLLPRFSIPFSETDITTIENAEDILDKFFLAFDAIENCSLIFKNIQIIYNLSSNQFYNSSIEDFFVRLIDRKSFQHNKVFFISDRIFKIPKIRNTCKTIHLSYLSPEDIKEIIKYEFEKGEKLPFAVFIDKVANEEIKQIIGGHPYIAKLFSRIASKVGVRELIREERLRERFEADKVEYLLKVIAPNPEKQKEFYSLNYLSLFEKKIDSHFLSHLVDDPFNTIEYLSGRFLLNVIASEDGTATYEVPALVKTCICRKLSKTEKNKIHNEIGKYYWDLAEKMKEVNQEYAFSALYHFEEAGNHSKINEFRIRFSKKFLERANEILRRDNSKRAYKLALTEYLKLFKIDFSIFNVYSWTNLIRCLKRLGVRDYPELSNKERNQLYKKAEEFCKEGLNKSSDYRIVKLYSSTLVQNKREEEGFKLLEKYISEFQNHTKIKKQKFFENLERAKKKQVIFVM